jgi:hypothetical protein
MSIAIFPKYSNIFPDQPIPNIEDLLSDVSSKLVIGILSYINGRLYINESIEEQEYLFNLMIERLNKVEIDKIKTNYDSFVANYSRKDIYIFPLYTLLQLIEWEVVNNRRIAYTESTAEQELKILQAILIYNERLDESHKNKGQVEKKGEVFYKIIWESFLPQLEFTRRKLFFSQFLIGFDFIDYLEKNHLKHLESYFKYLNVTEKEDIFRGIFEFMINGYNKEGNSYRNNFPVEIIQKNKLLEPLVLDLELLNIQEYINSGNDKYFKGLRKYPLLKHDKDTFDVVNWNFVTDKMTTNELIFDFYYNSTIKNDIPFHDFKSEIGMEFSEKNFLVSFLKNTFKDSKYLHQTSEDNEAITSDYYLRLDNKIILIEYKDYIMADSLKNSSYNQIKEYFNTNFIKSENGRAKGVTQLISQIDKIDKDYQTIEDFSKIGLDKSRLLIFPVIITKDFSFNVNGLNQYLNNHFKKEIKDKNLSFFLINDLILLDLKRLMDWAEDLMSDKLTFPSLLYNYLLKLEFYREASQRKDGLKNVLDSIASFSFLMIPNKPKDITEKEEFQKILNRLKLEK